MKSLFAAVLLTMPPLGLLPHADSATHLAPAAMVRAYFADLNAHRFHAAWRLEATCNVTFPIPNGPGATIGSGGYPGRGAWGPAPARVTRHPILASALVTRVTPLRIPILARNHILAFGVSGWYTFDYSLAPWANMKHRNGFHVVKLAVWRCNGRWGVETEEWMVGSGGELNWM